MTEEVDSDEDLTKELQPLAYHVSDKKRVLMEALKALKGKRLEAMIPPALKVWTRPKLESACLRILEDLDDEALLAILDGRAATAGVSAVEQPAQVKAVKSKSKKKIKRVEGAEEPDSVIPEPKKKRKKKAVTTEESQAELKAAKLRKKKKLAKIKAKEKLKKKKKSVEQQETAAASTAPPPHKSLMELLELEYRAKAIKALLRSQGQSIPDIPINIDGEESESGKVAEATQNAQISQNASVNGSTQGTSKSEELHPKLANSSQEKKSTKKSPEKSKPSTKGSEGSPVKLPDSHHEKRSPIKKSSVAVPKKAVIDLIDEALSTSLNSDVIPQENVTPPPVIVEACTISSESEELLRSKLLKKLEDQKKKAEQSKPVAAKKKKKKVKPVDVDLTETEQKEVEEDDILDLHPQELSLSDEERETSQVSENESSEYETDEDEQEQGNNEVAVEPENEELSPVSTTMDLEKMQHDELLYDSDQSEEENPKDEEIENNKDGDDGKCEEGIKNDEEREDQLWQDVQVDKDETNSNDKPAEEEPKDSEKDPVSPELGLKKMPEDQPESENSRSGIFSETARDDVFETVSNSKGTCGATTFASAQSLKRKITLRIDPARIGVLEAEGVEEETKKREEIKRKEEEKRKQEEEQRLANQVEVEEGEVYSGESSGDSGRQKSKRYNVSVSSRTEDLRTKLNRKRRAERIRSRSPSPQSRRRRSEKSHSSSDESTAYYSRKREPYKRSSPNKRDFGNSQKRTDPSDRSESSSPKKRHGSPVEFITQFSDMESISDDELDNSRPSTSQKKSQPRPTPVEKDEKVEEKVKTPEVESSDDSDPDLLSKPDSPEASKAGEESDDDDLPKPITWYERWAESHGMKKVAQTNKIHKKVRTKLKQVKSAVQKPELPKVPEPSMEAEPIIGSIEEYEKLFGKKVVVNQDSDNSKSNEADENKEENDEDEGDDDLWGDIIGS